MTVNKEEHNPNQKESLYEKVKKEGKPSLFMKNPFNFPGEEKMLKRHYQKIFFPSALLTLIWGGSFLGVSAQTLKLSSNLTNETLIVQGQTGGTVSSPSCGFINETPNQVIEISERVDYMRLMVEAEGGQPTLLVDGPDGKFCVLADNSSQDNPVMSGVWLPGTYNVYIGDRDGNPHNFTLSISQQR